MIQFFLLNSRLGLVHPPNHQKHLNVGVEDGGPAIVTPQYLQHLNQQGLETEVLQYTFALPDQNWSTDQYMEAIASNSQASAQFIQAFQMNDSIQVVVGGDHSVTFSSLLALDARHKLDTIGYIQIDSHGDIHKLETSPSGNFHGMYVRALTEAIGVPEVDTLVQHHLNPDHMMYIGNLDLEAEEVAYFQQHSIKSYSHLDIRNKPYLLESKVVAFCQRFPHTHLTIDIDAFDDMEAPATGIPCSDGILWADLRPLLTAIKLSSASVSIDLVEVNPRKQGAAETIQLAHLILDSLLLPTK